MGKGNGVVKGRCFRSVCYFFPWEYTGNDHVALTLEDVGPFSPGQIQNLLGPSETTPEEPLSRSQEQEAPDS